MKISSWWEDKERTLVRVKAESLAHKTFTGVIPRRDLVAFGNAARSRGHYQHNQVRVVGGVVHIDSCQLNFHNTRVLLVQLAQLLKEAGGVSRAEADTYRGFATTSVFTPPPQPTRETVESVAEWRARNQLFSHLEGGA